MITPQAVNPLPPLYATWKFGELRKVILYSVKSSQWFRARMRGTFWFRLLTFASCARSHQETFWPAIAAPPVDDSFAQLRRSGDMISRDQRFAAVALLI